MTHIPAIVREILDSVSKEEKKILDSGVLLVQPAPEIAPKAWLHVVFPHLTEYEIISLEKNLHQNFPEELRNFYESFNGISLFGSAIVIWGKRRDYARQGDGMWQPFDIIQHNAPSERPTGSPYQVVYFGSLEQGEYRLYFDCQSGEIGKTSANKFITGIKWPNFDVFFLSELRRQVNAD